MSPSRTPVADTTTYRPVSLKSPQTSSLAQSNPIPVHEPGTLSFNNTIESQTPPGTISANETTESSDSRELLAHADPITTEKPELVNIKEPLKTQESAQISVKAPEGPKLEPPPKPPRSPSPHPLRAEAFEEIDYEDEEEEDEVSSEGEDDENTVIYSNEVNASTELR